MPETYEPVTDEQLAELIVYKQAWFTDAKAVDATWPKNLQGGFENIEANIAALLELQERRKHHVDFGWANSWRDTPPLVARCRAAKHNVVDKCFDSYGLHNIVRCDICKYVYHYDSS